MNIEIDFRIHVPIYIQVMNQIKDLITAGVLKPGDQLPTVRQLASDLRINFNTIARSYRMLDEAGIISTQHGRGTFILDAPSEEQSNKMRKETLNRLTLHYLTEASRIDFSPEEVKTIFEEKLSQWIEAGAPPLPEADEED
ncbi:MAG: GntR family transcriptional regulator [Anaerolineae bacterium]|nr:GntR family transcriptional regulator [Anaerolineae bacterium]